MRLFVEIILKSQECSMNSVENFCVYSIFAMQIVQSQIGRRKPLDLSVGHTPRLKVECVTGQDTVGTKCCDSWRQDVGHCK